MPLRVYSTLTRSKEEFRTVEPGKVKMYLCGPTVYKPAHIGHMVGPVIFDTVKRYLAYSGYQVTWVVNITDVDDKLIVRAKENNTTVEALAKQMTQDYFDNLATIGVDGVDHFPYATAHIKEMLDMIGRLVEQGYAYPLNGDVYFEVTKDADYGKLSHRSVEQMLAGTRVEANDRKRNPADFALWKASKPGEPAWDSPWGPGRPGWHIECSAMAAKILGPEIDIHGGGLDLMFPHHENELAQSESCSGKPFARYWLHNGLMQASGQAGKVGGQHSRHGDTPPAGDHMVAAQADQEANKLAGSKGAASVKELFAVQQPETIRFFLLSTHYRSPIDFSPENIAATGQSLEGFYRLFETYQRVTGKDFYTLTAPGTREKSTKLDGEPADLFGELRALRDRYLEAMDDDFNTGGAVGVLFEMRKALNSYIAKHKLDAAGAKEPAVVDALTTGMTLLKELSNLLGVFRKPLPKKAGADDAIVDGLMALILELRADARKNKNWPVADKIRDTLKALKIVVEDRPDGVRWNRG
ncbi:MAG: cysteine--tRNA ligase [Planctomycetaceae bacterium]|nr:cysteine--tRNA ligase [Planctomycetaceae bacterium]